MLTNFFFNKNGIIWFNEYFSHSFASKIGKIGTWILLGYIFSHLLEEMNIFNFEKYNLSSKEVIVLLVLFNYIFMLLAGALFFEIVLILAIPFYRKIIVYLKPKWQCFYASSLLISIALGHIYIPPSVGPSLLIQNFNLNNNILKINIYLIAIAFLCVSFLFNLIIIIFSKRMLLAYNKKDKIQLFKVFRIFLIAFFSLLPLLFILVFKVLDFYLINYGLSNVMSEPLVSFLISIIVSYIVLFVINKKKNKKYNLNSLKYNLNLSGGIILIICSTSMMSFAVEKSNLIFWFNINDKTNLIMYSFFVSMFFRISIGSATSSFLLTLALIGGMMEQLSIKQYIALILAIGAGSSSISHINDTGFWLVQKVLYLNTRKTLKYWTFPLFMTSVVCFFISLVLFYV